MRYLPIALDIRGKPCLVVGAGQVALRKIELLLSAGALVRVVATRAVPEAQSLLEQGRIELALRPFAPSDLEHVELVVAATDAPEVNALVAETARARHLPVNVVDQPALCSFIVPAIIDRDPILIAVSTQGASPVLARSLRARIEAWLPHRLGELAQFAATHRARVRAALPEPGARRKLWERVIEGVIGRHVLDGDAQAADAALERALSQREASERSPIELIALPASEDDLTLSALRCLSGADLVVRDAACVELTRRFARRDARTCDLDPDARWLASAKSAHEAGQSVCVLAHTEMLETCAGALAGVRLPTRSLGTPAQPFGDGSN